MKPLIIESATPPTDREAEIARNEARRIPLIVLKAKPMVSPRRSHIPPLIRIPQTDITLSPGLNMDSDGKPFHQITYGTMTADQIHNQWPVAKKWLRSEGWKEYPSIRIFNLFARGQYSTVTGWRLAPAAAAGS